MTLTAPDSVDWSTHAFRMDSPCGRVYLVSMEAVRQDYVDFLVQEDHLDPEQARNQASFSDVHSWFLEQFNWDDIDRLGECIQQASPKDIARALDRERRSEHPSNVAHFEERPELVAKVQAEDLDVAMPSAPTKPARRF